MYQLLDFGAGRKLERFGPYVVDRPAPAAEQARPRRAELWAEAVARYDRRHEGGHWTIARAIEAPWVVRHGSLALELKLTEFGQVGVFAEQTANWEWIGRQVRSSGRALRVLNLFGYTGASTLAAAVAGAEVTHVDAALGVVAWARRNAVLSGLAESPIRWIAEDAAKFVRRELKRGRRYDAVILDPPAYGHGPHGETWKLTDDLPALVADCLQLAGDELEFLLLSCHTGELAFAAPLLKYLVTMEAELGRRGKLDASDLATVSLDGERLHAGAAVRWTTAAAAPDRASNNTKPDENVRQR